MSSFRLHPPKASLCARPLLWGRLALAFLLLGACDPKSDSEANKGPSPSAKPEAQAGEAASEPKKPTAKEIAEKISDLPPAEKVQAVVNSRKREPYSGPTGTVRGVVRVKGDEAPSLPQVLSKIEDNCVTAKETFGKVYREGEGRTLADVLVAVTEYDGYVPAKTVDVPVRGAGCAWETRTIAVTFGQRLAIQGLDNRPYVPEILGQPMPAQLFVLPTNPVVKLPPKKPGRFKLVDSMRLYNVAELFVLPYATMDVTGVDGKFEISGIPVGKVKVNALLPQTGAVEGKEVTIQADKVTDVDFVLEFDKSAWDEMEKPTPLDEIPGPKDR